MFWRDPPPRYPNFFDNLQEYDPKQRTAYRRNKPGLAGRLSKFVSKVSPIKWKTAPGYTSK